MGACFDLPSKDEFEALEREVRFFDSGRGFNIAYHEYGDPKGTPLFVHHGTGSHVHVSLLHKPASRLGFRIVAPDRPGVSLSEFRPSWTPLEYAADVGALAEHIGIETFGLLGISGAGPALFASAFAIPERLRCVVACACAAPVYRDPEMLKLLGSMDRLYAKLGATLPLALFQAPFALLGLTQSFMKSPKSFAKLFDSSLCAPDKLAFENPDVQYLIMRDFQELFRSGSKGPAYDAQTVYKDWGFELSAIRPHVEILQGSEDLFIPLKFSEYLAEKLKDASLTVIEGQGHFHHFLDGEALLTRVAGLLAR
jgi:pimeloyl-ACP methyl ester carboxylesterase